MIFFKSSKIIASGLSTISIIGSGVGIGVVFGSFLRSMALNPILTEKLFGYAILGFALTESIALFGLMITFLLLFGEV
jgi:F-type H+-transporting ATPase subunit c